MTIQTLNKLADIQTGPFGSQLHKEDYVDIGTPIVTVEHLGERVFSEQNLPMVSEKDKKRLNKYILEKGDIVFSRVGSVDRCSYVDKKHAGWMFSGRCLRVRPYEILNPMYLYYFFCMESTKKFIRNIAVGATMPSINTKLMGEIEVTYPDLKTQEKIANILSTIDDKIEENKRINQNLEEILQAFYQEMFCTNKTNSVSGNLADICSYSKNRIAVTELTLKTYYSTENMLPNKAGANIATSLPSISYATRCSCGDTLVSNIRPYFKKIVYCYEECGCSTDVLCFSPYEKKMSAYLYSTLYSDHFFDYVVAGTKGTKMPRGDKQQIMNYDVSLPDENDLNVFNEIAFPILEQLHSNRNENENLAAIRESILPRLMSGELDISNIDI